MRHDADFDSLWADLDRDPPVAPCDSASLPDAARRYFERALPANGPLDRAVRLEMHGELRLGATWRPFTATQVIHASRGFVWCASARAGVLRVSGSDRCVDGVGRSKWRLFGLFPVANAGGPDITRSSAERAAAELVFLPSGLLRAGEDWEDLGPERFAVTARIGGERTRLEIACDAEGAPREVSLDRWGTPDGMASGFRRERFGCTVLAEHDFDGRRIPSRLRAGWYHGTPRFEAEGEFFRATIVDARFR